jgi:hypothetical protein
MTIRNLSRGVLLTSLLALGAGAASADDGGRCARRDDYTRSDYEYQQSDRYDQRHDDRYDDTDYAYSAPRYDRHYEYYTTGPYCDRPYRDSGYVVYRRSDYRPHYYYRPRVRLGIRVRF